MLLAAVLAAPAPVLATASILDFSLEELSNIEVTSVSKRAERAQRAAASVFVITRDDIRLSGATTLPEVLRLAPNLQVAQISSSTYAISARGFNASTANKLLVLIDGRAVYTPLYSGVFWDDQFVFLPDVERIEVISGPGGTLWGANAVNGVINVVTRAAEDTQGRLGYVQAGDLQQGAGLRHGGQFGPDWNYRLYTQFQRHDGLQRANGDAVGDAWNHSMAGLRADRRSERSDWMLDAAVSLGRIDLPASPSGEQRNESGHLLLRNEFRPVAGSDLQWQAYFDYTHRDVPGSYEEHLRTLDLEVQQRSEFADRQVLTYGAGYRYASDYVSSGPSFAFLPARRNLRWSNVFAHYSHPISESLTASVGARLEYNPFSDWDVLPSARLAWQLNPEHFFWAALSRAVRAPSRIDTEFFFPASPPFLLTTDHDFRSEVADVLDLGYRGATGSLQYSITLFVAEYDRLRSVDRLPNNQLHLGNGIDARTHGVEAWAQWVISPGWRIDAGGIYLDQEFRMGSLSVPPEGRDPHVRWYMRSYWRWANSEEFALWLRRVGELNNLAESGYSSLNLRYAHHFAERCELALSGFNLLDSGQAEFASGLQSMNPSESQRQVQLSLTVDF